MAYQVMMPILDHEGSFDAIEDPRIVYSDGGDVDEQSSLGVDPPRINDVEPIILCAFHVAWVDLEHVVSAFGQVGQLAVIDRHAVVAREEVHCPLGNLSVDVGIPG